MESDKVLHSFTISSKGQNNLFRNLPNDVLHFVARVSTTTVYNRKMKLFVEGEKPRGMFTLCTGKAKLSTCSTLGKTIITRLVEPGEALGLSAVVSGRAYGATAEMMAGGEVNFIPRDSLLELMNEHHEIALAVAEKLSASYYSLHETLRSLGLAAHPMERLAKLLLLWTSAGDSTARTSDHSFKLPLTHQEIADSIGSTRETVSKLFSELRRSHLLRSEGGELAIVNRPELEQIVQF